jgi:hypothetical protein
MSNSPAVHPRIEVITASYSNFAPIIVTLSAMVFFPEVSDLRFFDRDETFRLHVL